MSQVVESADSCQSCQQDLYKSEHGSHLVWLARIILYICHPSFCVLSLPTIPLSASDYFGCASPDCFRIARFYMVSEREG
jgi:hypothetical protein